MHCGMTHLISIIYTTILPIYGPTVYILLTQNQLWEIPSARLYYSNTGEPPNNGYIGNLWGLKCTSIVEMDLKVCPSL